MNHDALMEHEIARRPNVMVPWYILSAYAYYHLDQPVLSDAAFDRLARRLLIDWKQTEHQHKHLITEGALRAGTLLLREDEYPSVAKGAARSLLADLRAEAMPANPSAAERLYLSILKP